MQERQMAREAGLEAEFWVPTKEEMEEQWAQSLFRLRQKMAEQGKVLVKGKERPWMLTPQGILKIYEGWPVPETANAATGIFQHLIPHHSGKHRHQGGFALFVLEGKGHTVVDGVRQDWEKGDLILLTVKPDGCEHQHFNDDVKPSRWMAIHPYYCDDAVWGGGGGQRDNSPLWKKYRPAYDGPWAMDTKRLAHERK